jgi:hypothetical protein
MHRPSRKKLPTIKEDRMLLYKRIVPLAFSLALTASPVSAQEWSHKTFPVRSHDFGTVASGAKAEYRFAFLSTYKETLHIASVSSDCGHVTAFVPKATVKSLEMAEVVVVLNTLALRGDCRAVVTVTLDQPHFAQVPLRITGRTRGAVIKRGRVDFGRVTQGEPAERNITITYVGRDDWQIVDARTANPHLEAELWETQRGAAKTQYELLVRLRKDAPLGDMDDELVIISGDESQNRVAIRVVGKVESAIKASDVGAGAAARRPLSAPPPRTTSR